MLASFLAHMHTPAELRQSRGRTILMIAIGTFEKVAEKVTTLSLTTRLMLARRFGRRAGRNNANQPDVLTHCSYFAVGDRRLAYAHCHHVAALVRQDLMVWMACKDAV